MVARNAWKGGQRAYVRSIATQFNDLLRRQRELRNCISEIEGGGL